MRVEKISFINKLDKPIVVCVEPIPESFDLLLGQTAHFHLHHYTDEFQDPLEMVMHASGRLVVYEQKQNLLEIYIETELVYTSDADMPWRHSEK